LSKCACDTLTWTAGGVDVQVPRPPEWCPAERVQASQVDTCTVDQTRRRTRRTLETAAVSITTPTTRNRHQQRFQLHVNSSGTTSSLLVQLGQQPRRFFIYMANFYLIRILPKLLINFKVCFFYISMVVTRPTQRSISPESVNEDQLRPGRPRQVWFIPFVDKRVGVQVKL